jgi:hypothetical protein
VQAERVCEQGGGRARKLFFARAVRAIGAVIVVRAVRAVRAIRRVRTVRGRAMCLLWGVELVIALGFPVVLALMHVLQFKSPESRPEGPISYAGLGREYRACGQLAGTDGAEDGPKTVRSYAVMGSREVVKSCTGGRG